MRPLKLAMLFLFLIAITNCERNEDLSNMTTDAKVVDFVTEKCYCCWGWVIEVGSNTIKADSIPGLSPSENLVFPFNVRISIGNHTRDCSEFSKPTYYEIKQCTLIK
jgi:hypothetical protein